MKRTLGSLSPTLVLTLTLLATAAAGWGSWVGMRNRVADRFDRSALELGEGVRSRIASDVASLRGAAAFVAIAGPVDAKTFERYVGALALGRDRPGVEGIGLAPRAAALAVADPIHRQVIEQACTTGDPAIASDTERVGDVTIYVPVNATRTGDGCWGVVFATLRTRALFGSVLTPERVPRGVGVRVVDDVGQVLYAEGAPASIEYSARRTVELPGRAWSLELIAPRTYAADVERWFPAGVIAIGVMVALVVFAVLRGQAVALRRERESREVLAALDDAGRGLAVELDLRRVPELVAQLVAQHTGAEVGAVIVAGELAAWHTHVDGQGAVLVRDALDDAAGRRWLSRATTTVGRSDRGDLTLTIASEEAGAFGFRARRILDGIATHAAVALDNATLLARTRALVAELERGNRALARSNRELDEFAYAASHDLRAPLRSLSNLIDWLEEDLGDRLDDQTAAYLGRMRGRLQRLENLVDALLRYARAGREVATSEVEPARVLEQVVRELGPDAKTHVHADPLPAMRADPEALHQVLHQLVSNALRHAGREDVHVEVHAVEHDDAWELVVADDGRGVPEDLQQRIWEMFETIEPRDRVDGSGLGLALVRKLVEAAGGRTWVVSRPEQGAAFHVTWPRDPSTASG